MSMFKIDELSGSLIKSGRFDEAIEKFGYELNWALTCSVLTRDEVFGDCGIIARFNRILLNPSNADAVERLGNDMLLLAMRIPDYVQRV